MKIRQVVEGVYMVPLGAVNAFMLKNDNGLVLLDARMPGDAPKIWNAIQSLGFGPADLQSVLLTHCHSDHRNASGMDMPRGIGWFELAGNWLV